MNLIVWYNEECFIAITVLLHFVHWSLLFMWLSKLNATIYLRHFVNIINTDTLLKDHAGILKYPI